jgi:hypothetical protein
VDGGPNEGHLHPRSRLSRGAMKWTATANGVPVMARVRLVVPPRRRAMGRFIGWLDPRCGRCEADRRLLVRGRGQARSPPARSPPTGRGLDWTGAMRAPGTRASRRPTAPAGDGTIHWVAGSAARPVRGGSSAAGARKGTGAQPTHWTGTGLDRRDAGAWHACVSSSHRAGGRWDDSLGGWIRDAAGARRIVGCWCAEGDRRAAHPLDGDWTGQARCGRLAGGNGDRRAGGDRRESHVRDAS